MCHTRWTTEDPIGWLIKEHSHEKWVELRLPAIAESDDILGRKTGDALWPTRYPKRVLDNIKLAMKSTRRWNAIYQQRPVPEEGALVKSDWFSQKYYNFDGNYISFRVKSSGDFVKERVIKIVQSWDTAYKKEEINDPSVCTTWAILRNGYALIDVFSRRMEYPELKKMMVNFYDEYAPSAILVEDRSSGQSLLQEFKFSRLPVIGVQVSRDKAMRLSESSDLIEAGKVFLPEFNPPWLEGYTEELTTFPYGGLDDQVDSTSLFLNWAKKRTRFKKKTAHKYYK
jgi:predicted phage terminase large subunit-like protein